MTQETFAQKHKGWVATASIFALILIILYALGIIGGGDRVEPGNTEARFETLPEGARTLTLKPEAADNPISLPGTVQSRTVAKIAPKLNARILSINVNAGDRVKRGDLLAVLDERVYRASYNEALAALKGAKAMASQAIADEVRAKALYADEATTRENYDAVLARADAARANIKRTASAVEQAGVLLGEHKLRAPFDGVISDRLKEPGDMGVPNDPIVILQKSEDLRFEVAIPTRCVDRIELGMTLPLRTDSPERRWTGKVAEIVPEIDRQTRSQVVKIDLAYDKALEHGQFGWLEMNCGEARETLFVPSAAVLHYGQLEAVKIVEQGRVYTRHVRTGKRRNGDVEILSGLHAGDTILVDGEQTR